MHCVALYPTPDEKLNLGRIREIHARYKVTTGFSTHEYPNNLISGPLALASGAQIFERHYAKEKNGLVINGYSSTRVEFENWLAAICNARQQLIDTQFQQNIILQKKTLEQLKRGQYASRDIEIGEVIDNSNTYSAIPVQEGQLTANELSLRTTITVKTEIRSNEGVMHSNCIISHKTENLEKILSKTREIISKANLTLGNDIDVEISHHYGLSKFTDYGAVLIPLINREYAKKLVVMLKHQQHPEHFHKLKEETFVILIGSLKVILEGTEKTLKPGDVLLIPRMYKHLMVAIEDTVFEEISSTNFSDDSYYTDSSSLVTERKTPISIWF
jgi:N-acetylneuraminate synthase